MLHLGIPLNIKNVFLLILFLFLFNLLKLAENEVLHLSAGRLSRMSRHLFAAASVEEKRLPTPVPLPFFHPSLQTSSRSIEVGR